MKDHLHRMRRLTQVVMISGTCNVILLAVLVYFFVKERPPRPYFELKPAERQEQQAPLAVNCSAAQIINQFRHMPLDQLRAKLTNATLVENGFTQRELALACLVAFCHFDLSRALLGEAQPLQKRKMSFGKYRNGREACIDVYPGLSEKQFESIIQFANREKWPLTSQGMFLAWKHNPANPSLIDAFFLTPEFLAIEMLFNRAEVAVSKNELLNVICDGDWPMISNFMEQQRVLQDLSPASRQRFLLNYIQHNSKAAAYLMLKTDGVFAAKKLDDRQVLQMLRLIDEKNSAAELFIRTISNSPRSDLVRQMAALRLSEHPGKSLLEKKPVVSEIKSLPLVKPILTRPVVKKIVSTLPMRRYVVQKGDSLWKIAKRYKVNIETLKSQNQLESDFLKPGITLKIP